MRRIIKRIFFPTSLRTKASQTYLVLPVIFHTMKTFRQDLIFSTLEIVLSLAEHEDFCPAEALFDHDHPIQQHLESALLVDVVYGILALSIGTRMQVFVVLVKYFDPPGMHERQAHLGLQGRCSSGRKLTGVKASGVMNT